MWCGFGKSNITVATACLITASVVISDVAFAARTYTPRQFRAVLRGLGYSVKVSDAPLTTADTKNAIQEFQKGHKLKPADGIVGPKTQDVAAKIVETLQANLNLVAKPNPLLPSNQYYGSQTEAAVKLYQKKLGLQQTGIADLALRQKLTQQAKNIKKEPTSTPTTKPRKPTTSPTTQPTPTAKPTKTPTSTPRTTPTAKPTTTPTSTPEALPTATPTSTPEALPTGSPTSTPGVSPTATPTPTPTR
ncbi:MAG: peptidoglycan-binding protein [Brasilonema octagenarum HA4186-MV1]|jgi:peptidoglycan hydrolase-like protein with peptidoglycan-binding domain|uniref:Peptidoglycan-binding protein n=2 Tax=Brasilonema TaxID=383614 RepID=A0A856M8V3_9CYAN|nr:MULTISPECIES: peptidoglycan-binding protein [Brasilonema]MBW4626446.1 peptidoglycan-binding protein [Brasilonema octagenarum HA4186-MV1]NMF62838.1 peptidoglycan-binding protein [Brasilonema octagenarum UFV-OR1]QDL07593.1 peptidoglycan-binding protein [Brasilonema sennae CENA114]QDL13955.1 peptidoglycan-binding protein [Brasilonema octagenarum UFV-E1]